MAFSRLSASRSIDKGMQHLSLCLAPRPTELCASGHNYYVQEIHKDESEWEAGGHDKTDILWRIISLGKKIDQN